MPDERGAPALDTSPVLQFDVLFDAPTVDDHVAAGFAPNIADPGMLEPASYAAALDAAQALLAGLSAQPDGGVFAEALAVLEQAAADRAVLDIGRRALLRA